MKFTTKIIFTTLAVVSLNAQAFFSSDVALVDLSPTMPKQASLCLSCHGNGLAQPGLVPVPMIAGQSKEYIKVMLEKFKYGKVQSSMMTPVSQYLSDKDIVILAEYYSQLNPYSALELQGTVNRYHEAMFEPKNIDTPVLEDEDY